MALTIVSSHIKTMCGEEIKNGPILTVCGKALTVGQQVPDVAGAMTALIVNGEAVVDQ